MEVRTKLALNNNTTMNGFLVIYLVLGAVLVGLWVATRYHEKHGK